MFEIYIDNDYFYSTKPTNRLVWVEDMPNKLSDVKELLAYKYNPEIMTLELDEEKLSQLDIKSSLDVVKESKINELSNICNEMIELGVNINGEQFSYTLTDQNNISAAVLLAQQTGMSVPYHSNGNTCRLMSLAELMTVYVYQQMNLMHHQTYYNQLKLYIQNEFNNENDVYVISDISYGDELTGVYLETYNTMMEQSQNLASAYTQMASDVDDSEN